MDELFERVENMDAQLICDIANLAEKFGYSDFTHVSALAFQMGIDYANKKAAE